LIPKEPLLSLKGIAIVVADGISSSAVGHVASQSAVKTFLTDYYCTSDAWSVKTAAQRVLAAANSWLHAQTRRSPHPHDADRGYVCALSAMVLKGRTAHLLHVGDARIYRVAGHALEQLTDDHRVVLSAEQSYLGRALGADPQIDIDYRAVPLEVGDIFVLATDGVYEHVDPRFVTDAVAAHATALDEAARAIAEEAFRRDSPDNLTVQIVRIDALPDADAGEMLGQAAELPLPPLLEIRMVFDGFRIVRELHASSRSHLYLAVDTETDALAVIKIPSIDLRGDPAYLKRLMMEDWVARRLDSAHVLKPWPQSRKRNYLYVVTEFVDGQTLAQWMVDNPKPRLETVRGLVEQIAKGLRAFHRMEMLHQDLRPQNVMIDTTGTVKLIDFGATRVAGVAETLPAADQPDILGTLQYTAPEYFLGGQVSSRADLFSLGVITYQMLSGRLPYGTLPSQAKTRAQLKYRSLVAYDSATPAWIDEVLKKALHPDPLKRYEDLSEFVYDLRQPPGKYSPAAKPLLDRNPLLFWKLLSAILAALVLGLLAYR
jgi:serine/threonine protein phosphatase PrpC